MESRHKGCRTIRLRWLLGALGVSLAPQGAAKAPPHAGELAVPGQEPIYYFEPKGSQAGERPLYVYLHGRGAKPLEECARWAAVVRARGWLLCPGGPKPHAQGQSWGNSWSAAHTAVLAGVKALKARFGGRVQQSGRHTLVGFSEGAYAAMNVGLREPALFDRWLILAANSKYLGQLERTLLKEVSTELSGVYLLTGKDDGVASETRAVELLLRKAGIPTRRPSPPRLAHELLLEKRPEIYEAALDWLEAQSRSPAKKE